MLDIKITRTTSPKEKPDENNLGFGKKFTDHMFVMLYRRKLKSGELAGSYG